MSTSSVTLTSLLLRGVLRTLSATWRYREEMPEDVAAALAGPAPVLIAFWHGKMFPVWYRFRRSGASALISGSRDGELLARYLERSLGYIDVIRGSSSKGGSRALGELVAMLGERSCLITPDGPRGPARRAKVGALVASRRAGCDCIGVGWSCRRAFIFNSWDRMEIPWPFSVINIRYCKITPTNNTGTGRNEQSDDNRATEEKIITPSVKREIGGSGETSGHRPIGPDEIDRFESMLNSISGESR